MVQMSGGQAVVQTLITLGARAGFGVPGESYLAVLDAFCDAPGFRFIGCRNEGGAAFTNNITISASGSQLINSSNTAVLEVPYSSIQLYCNGTNKFFIF